MKFGLEEPKDLNDLIRRLTVPRVDETFSRINGVLRLHYIEQITNLEKDTQAYLDAARSDLRTKSDFSFLFFACLMGPAAGVFASENWFGHMAVCCIAAVVLLMFNHMHRVRHARHFRKKLFNISKIKAPETKAKHLLDLVASLRFIVDVLSWQDHEVKPNTRVDLDKLCTRASVINKSPVYSMHVPSRVDD